MATSNDDDEVRRWRTEREAGLLDPVNGWLAVVGLDLLSDGDGSHGLNLELGTLTVTADGAILMVQPGLDVRVVGTGQAVHGAYRWPSDEHGAATRLTHGGRTFELIRRGQALAVRTRDPAAPGLRAFTGLSYFPVDARWRIEGRLAREVPPRTLELAYSIGTVGARVCPGRVHFTVAGQVLSLDPVLTGAGRLHFIVRDATAADSTYPSGRFLYTPPPDADGRVVLDFNRAESPPCAYTDYATCPLPPPQNILPLRVEAGEKYTRH
jgi:uncharacterized protein (DUF1684 family)